MKSILSLLSLLVFVAELFGQAPDTLWTRTYGTSFTDECYSLISTMDSGLVMAGKSDGFQAGNWDYFVVKTDFLGDTIWTRSIGGGTHDIAESVCETVSGQYAVAGWTGQGTWDLATKLVSYDGTTSWQRQFGGIYDQFGKEILSLTDGQLVVVGSFSRPGIQDAWVVCLDLNGDSVWTAQVKSRNSASVYGLGISEGSWGGFGLAGYCTGGFSGIDGFAAKLGIVGDTLWTKRIGGDGSDYFYSVVTTQDSGLIVAGSSSSFGASEMLWLVKYSSSGELEWQRTYGGASGASARDILQLTDGNYLISGFQLQSSGNSDGLLLKIDEFGDSLWALTVDVSYNDKFYECVEPDSGQYYACGTSSSSVNGLADYLLAAFTPESFKVLYPTWNDVIPVFSTDTIRWTGVGFEGGVSIELNRHYPHGEWEVIADSTENDREYEWFVTDPLSDSCRIRICALQDTFCDVSDGNFSIVSSQGYLGLIRSSAPNSIVTAWDAGTIECANAANQTFRVKNFGSEPIVVFQPLEPQSAEFSRTTTCGSFFALAPGGISTCSLSVSFTPTIEGLVQDTLQIQTDAVNGVGGFVSIPLSGNQIQTPESPEVVISTFGNNAVLNWSPIVESIGHCQIDPPSYLVFFSEDPEGPFWFHGGTNDTTYTHTWALQYTASMFYHVYAVHAEPGLLAMLPDGNDAQRVSEADIMFQLNQSPFRK